LFVLDNSRPTDELSAQFSERIANKRVITVLNKSDLPSRFDSNQLPEVLSDTVQISAKNGTGIEDLRQEILQTSGVTNVDLRQPICFTDRQENLLKQLTNIGSRQQAISIISELLEGQV